LRTDSFSYEFYIYALCLYATPKGPSVGVTADKEDILVEFVPQTINPKLFADRPAMGDVVTTRYI